MQPATTAFLRPSLSPRAKAKPAPVKQPICWSEGIYQATNVVSSDHEAKHCGIRMVEVAKECRELNDAATHALVIPEEEEGTWSISMTCPT